jgi:hypothetical protein
MATYAWYERINLEVGPMIDSAASGFIGSAIGRLSAESDPTMVLSHPPPISPPQATIKEPANLCV